MNKTSILLITIIITITTVGAFAKSSVEKNSTLGTAQGTTNTLPAFSYQELAKFDGKNGNKAYVAIDGTVYDVTNNPQWPEGRHKLGIQAGGDRSAEINSAPHQKKVLSKLTVVGIMK